MTAFIVRVVFIVVFLIGLGAIAEKVTLIFHPEEKEDLSLIEFHPPEIKMLEELPAPDLKVVRLETVPAPDLKVVSSGQPRKIIIRRLPIDNTNEVRMKIGPIMPVQFEQKVDVIREEKDSQ